MKLGIQLLDDLQRIYDEEERAGRVAVTEAIRAAGEGIKQGWRRQVVGAGLGQRLANAIRSKTYPEGKPSLNAAGLVYAQPKSAPKILDAFNRGVLIRRGLGLFLAFPTEHAGRSLTRGKITPREWEARTGLLLRLVYRPGQPSLLVADLRRRKGKRGGFAVPGPRSRAAREEVPIFILIPQVSLGKRLDLESEVRLWVDRLPEMIAGRWQGPP